MKSLSSVGLGLSIVFGCLILALLAEIYYLLWWKRRFTNKEIEDDCSSNAGRELFYMFRLEKPSSSRHSQDLCSSGRITDTLFHHHQQDPQQLDMNTCKDSLQKPFGDDTMGAEFARLQSLSGPPRCDLFTIVEETKEDLLESEDGKSRGDKSVKGSRGRSLSDLLQTAETPYLSPLTSPPFCTPPLTPSCNQLGFNPLFETATDAEFNKMRASPPPKFKFLQDAEEKLYRRKLAEEAEMELQKECGLADHARNDSQTNFIKCEEDGPFITIIVDRNKERASATSPTTTTPTKQFSPSALKPPTGKSPIFQQRFISSNSKL